MIAGQWRAGCCVLGLALAGCGTVEVQPQTQLPPPLIDQLPVTVGVHYPPEFRSYVHKETRYQVDYEINLGPAHVIKLTRLLEAIFAHVVEVDDPSSPKAVDPGIVMVLEPRFEDYAFLTPRDMVGEAYTVTIRYRLNLYDPEGQRVDGYVFTGYGRQKSGALTGSRPLAEATQRAMRDAGAKLAVELPEQDSVRLLLAGEKVRAKHDEQQARREALGSFGNGEPPHEPAVADDERPAPAPESEAAPQPAAPAEDSTEPGEAVGADPVPPASEAEPVEGAAPAGEKPETDQLQPPTGERLPASEVEASTAEPAARPERTQDEPATGDAREADQPSP